MAKGNMLQGQATGKVGDIVFMVRNGQQVARVYTSAGGRSGDQASIAVRRQRVRFGAASNQYLLYRNIVRGMYRTGKSTKQSDYNFFVRENVDLLPYLTREENAAGVKCAMPGTFSRGTLGTLIYSLEETQSGGAPETVVLNMQGFSVPALINYGDTVQTLKEALRLAFPNARKVTYSVCHLVKSELSLTTGAAYSHTFERGDVVFDLYEADPDYPDTTTLANYFAAKAPASLTELFRGQGEDDFADSGSPFCVGVGSGGDSSILNTIYVNLFATNDQVGDCYTSVLSEIIAPDSDGGLSLYSTLRTDDHRQVAEDSYGYATGVMRTNIQQA
jgi:hypothetical protein